MTNHLPFIVAIKSSLPESSWPWVMAALRHDRLVWKALGDPAFSARALSELPSRPEAWSPAALALLSLEAAWPTESAPFDMDLLIRARQEFSAFVNSSPEKASQDNTSLESAALLALAMLERRRELHSWIWLPEDLQTNYIDYPGRHAAWNTAMAILYGLTEDRIQLLQVLVNSTDQASIVALALHALLSQPTPAVEREKTLVTLMNSLSFPDDARLVSLLAAHLPSVCAKLARRLVKSLPDLSLVPLASDFEGQVHHISSLLWAAELHAIASQPAQAAALRSMAIDILRHLQGNLANSACESVFEASGPSAAVEAWRAALSGPLARSPVSVLLCHYLDGGRIDQARDLLGDLELPENSPALWLIQAHQAIRGGDQISARQAARRVLQSITPEILQGEGSAFSQVAPVPEELLPMIMHLADLLLSLSLAEEAVQATRLALALQPDRPTLLVTLGQSARQAGDLALAVQACHLAVALEPGEPSWRRELAMSLESSGDWPSALQERTTLLDTRFASSDENTWPPAADWRALAKCAVHAGDPQRAILACQGALQKDPEDGLAQAILGEAYSELGDEIRAMESFRLATQQAPHQAEPWLDLAQAYHQAGQLAKVMETLSAASHAVPNEPSVHLALAETYLEKSSITQALASLRQAYDLVATPASIASHRHARGLSSHVPERELRSCVALRYGQVLFNLGHLAEARQVLEDAFQAHPAYPNLAYTFARTLLALNNPQAALAPLAVALRSEPVDPQPYLDYGKALLIVGSQPGEAVRALQSAQEFAALASTPRTENVADISATPHLGTTKNDLAGRTRPLSKAFIHLVPAADPVQIRVEIQTSLAEALEADGQYQAALQAYYRALDLTPLTDNARRDRLSLGLGRTALRLDQPEITIAALQECADTRHCNPVTWRLLAEAYAAIHLPEEAIQSARTAVDLAPDDVDTLAWFAERAIDYGIQAESLPALTRAIQLDPARSDLVLRLAEIEASQGDKQAAQENYLKLLDTQNIDPELLYQAANGLLDLDDLPGAVACLERALESGTATPPWLLRALADAYRLSGKPESALEVLDRALQVEPDDANMYSSKAELLTLLDRPQAAQACLERALNLHPKDPQIHLRLGSLLRSQGDLLQARFHAEQAAVAASSDPTSEVAQTARVLAAELARALLIPDLALSWLEASWTPHESDQERQFDSLDQPRSVTSAIQSAASHCLAAELALDREQEVAAAQALNGAAAQYSDLVRVQALQARLAYRRGDLVLASDIFEIAYKTATEETISPGQIDLGDLLGLALAAIDLGDWESAFVLLDRATEIAPKEPFVHLMRARAMITRAEHQQFCQSLDAIQHAPGLHALSLDTYQVCKDALQSALYALNLETLLAAPDLLRRWNARAQAIFYPSTENAKELQSLAADPLDHSALIAALSQDNDLTAVTQAYHRCLDEIGESSLHPLIYAQFALALGFKGRRKEDLEESQTAARIACDQVPGQPLYQVLYAKISRLLGQDSVALHALENALTLWPDEPRWHSLAASLSLVCGDDLTAISHLEQAVKFEPTYLPHYLNLGKAYLDKNTPEPAIRALEAACELAPADLQPRLVLAEAYLLKNDLESATRHASQAMQFAPDQVAPRMILAEIALRSGDLPIARMHAETVLRHDPENPAGLHVLARALDGMGCSEEALDILEKAIPVAPDPLPFLLEKARLLSCQGGKSASLAALQELADQYPDEAKVLAPLADELARAGKHTEAIRAAQRALRNGRSDLPAGDKAALHFLLGRLLRQTGQLDQAIHQLNEATRMDSADVEPYLELGEALYERRQYALAMDTYRKAISIAPQDPRPYLHAGIALKASRDYQGAEKMFRRAAELSPDDVHVHRQLAALVAMNLVESRRTANPEPEFRQ